MEFPVEDLRHTRALLQLMRDSACGYEAAAAQSADPLFRDVFTSRARERARLATCIELYISSLGGEREALPANSAERTFLHLKEAVARGDDAVFNEVKIGEDRIKQAFETSIAEATLSAATRSVLRVVYGCAWIGQQDDDRSNMTHTQEDRMEWTQAM